MKRSGRFFDGPDCDNARESQASGPFGDLTVSGSS